MVQTQCRHMVKMQQKHVHDKVLTWQLMNFFFQERERERANGKWVKTDDQAVRWLLKAHWCSLSGDLLLLCVLCALGPWALVIYTITANHFSNCEICCEKSCVQSITNFTSPPKWLLNFLFYILKRYYPYSFG